MSAEDDYQTAQETWEELRKWGMANPKEWEEHELLNNEELLRGIEAEIQGRETAREEQGEHADQGHDDRIQKLQDIAQTVKNQIAYCKGEYSHVGPMQGGEAGQQEAGPGHAAPGEAENGGIDYLEDMDISDDDTK
ncbi:hypothetical protein LTR10_023251 [Elasticomyces elasticus]|uniref:Uncharacterized protein n=1 Tax=Exophiala sideris TaxID=1016849 RepID=A0ABR0J1X7_9EURO|nr:hypothetical protein LTR10_023251 [Elasticomyces elasticus]KAK5024743.1 hypothetical protein LTS07_008589 [Exophiala sideris]KAK5030836.1 hypothetical protein LTR13_008190 [Exophiala sideris]KAK5054378.1 hypothetical protein LTR69_008993 [Exophiala sideris]KAK5179778.1 hypothetical protein LTR44_007946 [Eurotiomycetes sp. CCFEE 6388]